MNVVNEAGKLAEQLFKQKYFERNCIQEMLYIQRVVSQCRVLWEVMEISEISNYLLQRGRDRMGGKTEREEREGNKD